MRRAPLPSGPRPGLAVVMLCTLCTLGMITGTPAHARTLGLPPPPSEPPPPGFVPPARPVQVDLRLGPERRLGGALLRITPQQPDLGPVRDLPVSGPTMTVALRPGSYLVALIGRRHNATLDIVVRPGMPTVRLELERRTRPTTRPDTPRFIRDRKLASGLAVTAMVQVLTGAGLLVAGAVRETAASRRNEGLLMDALVDAAAPTPKQPTGLALVEATYPTAGYHRDLSRAMTFEVAGGAVVMAGLGAALNVVPVAEGNRLRVAYIEMGLGAVLAAGGAAWLTVFERDRKALLSTTADPSQRVTTGDLRPLGVARTGGSLLTGLGIGLVVFPAIALLTNAVKRRREQAIGFTPYMAPGQAGLAFHGRF